MSFIIGDSLGIVNFRKENNEFGRRFIQVNGRESFVSKSSNIDKDSKGQTRSVISENKKALNIAVASDRKLSESRLKKHITNESKIGTRTTYATKNRTTLASVNRLRLLRNKRLKLVQVNLSVSSQGHVAHNVSLMERQKKAGIIGNSQS